MDEQQAYNTASLNLSNAVEYVKRIGKPYAGGRGGVGEVRAVTVGMTVYFQPYDGATNYHDLPCGLQAALGTVVRKNAAALLAEAVDLLRENRKRAAQAFYAKMAEVAKVIEP